MSSRFVSAGAINPSTGEVTTVVPVTTGAANPPQPSSSTPAPAAPTTTTATPVTTTPAAPTKKQAEWAAIQSQLDAARLATKTAAAAGPEPPSLYETLQANKAAKEAAHEEACRLRNQFRALDEDEIGFLEDVREAKRAEEERVRRETEEGLKAFREGRGVVARGGGESEEEDGVGEVGWEVGGGKRRRKGGEGGEGRKRRVVGVLGRKGGGGGEVKGGGGEEKEEVKTEEVKTEPVVAVKKPGGLVDYGSSDDDD
ncbi:N-terminal domain of NEFA-interacting nuclear protein NIP30-domain-containing protein [Podospora conica]|nr:N-terminal domain of NEFA-interacting nuclear protein NIP30-domain-containing protein [Schizothecium conicum]